VNNVPGLIAFCHAINLDKIGKKYLSVYFLEDTDRIKLVDYDVALRIEQIEPINSGPIDLVRKNFEVQVLLVPQFCTDLINFRARNFLQRQIEMYYHIVGQGIKSHTSESHYIYWVPSGPFRTLLIRVFQIMWLCFYLYSQSPVFFACAQKREL